MTLSEQTSLIDAMIKENPDYTIRDFFDLLGSIRSVEDSMKIKRYPALSNIGPFIFHQITTANEHYRKTHTPLRLYGC